MKKMHPIEALIEQGEHQQLDFKFEVSDSKKIARTLSAFANTDGGRLLIGVEYLRCPKPRRILYD